jgi:FkbM family methyltransferase
MIAHLQEAVQPGDRVLVIGAGLGVVSSLLAKIPGVERVIAVEADPAVMPYLQRVHALNDVKWVETVNAVLTDNRTGRVPFFSRHDIRASSLLPGDGDWEQVMRVPCMDLNLILAEEKINLIVCEIPTATAQLLECAELGLVERILVNGDDTQSESPEASEVSALLAERGFAAEKQDAAALFGRSDEDFEEFELTERRAG